MVSFDNLLNYFYIYVALCATENKLYVQVGNKYKCILCYISINVLIINAVSTKQFHKNNDKQNNKYVFHLQKIK